MLRNTNFSLAIAATLALATGGVASAQEVESEYSVERFRLSTDRGGILDVELAEVVPHMRLELSAWFGYADDPLNVTQDTPDGRQRVGSIVSRRLGGNLLAAIGLFDRVEVGIDIPLIFSQDDDLGTFMQVPGSLSSFGIGDVRLVPKIALLRGNVNVAVALGLTLPTSSSADYFGDGQVTFVPEVLVSHRIGDRVRLGANLGYRVREQRRALDLEVNDEVFAHLGVGTMVTDLVELDGTFSLATAANDPFSSSNRNHSELRGGVGFHLGELIPFVAAGIGTTEGFGTPDWRLLIGARYAIARDKDERPVDRRFIVDTDGDGLTDDVDKCVNEPETFNGIDDEDGCPEDLMGDSDGDGLLDNVDMCPTEPEDMDAFEDGNGCPDPDNDEDGVLDFADNCINVYGVVENRGCPDLDTDGDTVVDRLDNCPAEPGPVSNNGCKKKQLVVIKEGKLEILDRVFFRTDKDIIIRRSYLLLDNVALVLVNHPEIKLIRVEGHTDSQGGDEYNKDLSQRRAEAVMAYLVKKGVDAGRLEAIGYGEEKPIETNDTADGRAANRRVEFNLLGAGGNIEKKDSGPSGDTID